LILEKANVIATPGIGVGPSGAGYVSFSAFGSKQETIEAYERLKGGF